MSFHLCPICEKETGLSEPGPHAACAMRADRAGSLPALRGTHAEVHAKIDAAIAAMGPLPSAESKRPLWSAEDVRALAEAVIAHDEYSADLICRVECASMDYAPCNCGAAVGTAAMERAAPIARRILGEGTKVPTTGAASAPPAASDPGAGTAAAGGASHFRGIVFAPDVCRCPRAAEPHLHFTPEDEERLAAALRDGLVYGVSTVKLPAPKDALRTTQAAAGSAHRTGDASGEGSGAVPAAVDLDAIEARHDESGWRGRDVMALVAEVRRLREELATLRNGAADARWDVDV